MRKTPIISVTMSPALAITRRVNNRLISLNKDETSDFCSVSARHTSTARKRKEKERTGKSLRSQDVRLRQMPHNV
ncbi:hypothetical protein CEXT_224311 [Caerostris extrusa]|uniref:Uncharacterized protein n=1 Tax=Caerostris extrusa TaxID=172846 RepID=A0AAV4XF18_CAEEX|nr:hypothetical protein CEXT_224311 [Caerostris extrusa]